MKNDLITKYPVPDDSRPKKVGFIVFDCDSFDFWKEYHNLLNLEQDKMGCSFRYADFGKKRPCWATLWFYNVNGIFTAFVDAHGRYVDYSKLEEYVFVMCGMTPTPDNHCTGLLNTHHHPAFRKTTQQERVWWMERDIKDLQEQLVQMKRAS